MFLEASVYHFSMSVSDHCLLVLALKRNQPRKPPKKRFMFEAMWTREEGCRDVVVSAWDLFRNYTKSFVTDKLKWCQDQLQRWNWREFGNVNKVLRQKQSHLQQLEVMECTNEKAKEIRNLKAEINEVLLREEIMWNQRLRALWIKWGDQNTKFFQATASQRRRKNRIVGLKNAEGMWQEDRGRIENIILEYFAAIFRSDCPTNFEASLSAINTQVTPEMNDELLTEFRADEVESALKQMHPTKAPSPDGMSPIFYQKYWDIVGYDVTNCVLEALNAAILPSCINETYICLIPKVKNP